MKINYFLKIMLYKKIDLKYMTDQQAYQDKNQSF